MPTVIHTLQKKDIPLVLKCIEETIHSSYFTEFPDTPNIDQAIQEEIDIQRDRLEQVGAVGTPYFFVARMGKAVVGTLAYGTPEDTIQEGLRRLSRTGLSSVVELKSMFIKPSAQRKGIGGELLTAVMEDIRKKGYHSIAVFTGFLAGKSFWEKKFGRATMTLEHYDGEKKLWIWIQSPISLRVPIKE